MCPTRCRRNTRIRTPLPNTVENMIPGAVLLVEMTWCLPRHTCYQHFLRHATVAGPYRPLTICIGGDLTLLSQGITRRVTKRTRSPRRTASPGGSRPGIFAHYVHMRPFSPPSRRCANLSCCSARDENHQEGGLHSSEEYISLPIDSVGRTVALCSQ